MFIFVLPRHADVLQLSNYFSPVMNPVPIPDRCLGVVIPVYNEEKTLHVIVEKVLARPEVGELVMVNDCSSDGTWQTMQALAKTDGRIRIFTHEVNQGKGAALRTGFQHINSDIVIIQDADLEYDPEEYPKLLTPILMGRADVVFGSRFLGSGMHRVLYYWHCIGNQFLTVLSNMFTNLNLTDMETCYKVFRREVLGKITIEENRFGFEPEITAKVARLKVPLYEVSISYYGRTYEEGKKIGWKDGVRAVWCILKYNVFR
jgi:glycosyltransferase involved in cell wall biosynthesis